MHNQTGLLLEKQKFWLFWLLLIPFFINDLSNIFVSRYATWLAIDYSIRIFQVALLVLLAILGRLRWSDFGFGKIHLLVFLNYTILISVIAYYVGSETYMYLSEILPKTNLGIIPYNPHSRVILFDMIFGVTLVGISEEMIIRGLGFGLIRDKLGTTSAYLVCSVIFALMHWSCGIPNIVAAFFIGLIFTISAHKTGTIWPSAVGHFFYNLISIYGFVAKYHSPFDLL